MPVDHWRLAILQSYLEFLERQECVLLDHLYLVVRQVQHLDCAGALKDLVPETADLVPGEPESVEGREPGKGGWVHLDDLVLAQVERAQVGAKGFERRVRDVAEKVGVKREVVEGGTAVLEEVPEMKEREIQIRLYSLHNWHMRRKEKLSSSRG